MVGSGDELTDLRRENSILRGLLPRLGAACPYCGLTDMSKCVLGFPGCGYADDLMVSGDEHAVGLLKRLREAERLLSLAKQPVGESSSAGHDQ